MLEVIVAPLRWRRGPRDLQAAGDGVATLAGAYSYRVLHSSFAVDAAIVGGICSAVVATIAFLTAAGRDR